MVVSYTRTTATNYSDIYSARRVFLKYPADWVLRFYNMHLKEKLAPGAKVLDFGCGSGNNAVFFAQQGYDVSGTDVTETVQPLVQELFENAGVEKVPTIEILDPVPKTLPFEDNTFDFVLSNQVLYYLSSQEAIQSVTNEISRTMKPGATVFFTMMGLKHYYITHHSPSMKDNLFEVEFESSHRLGDGGYHEYIYVPRDEEHLISLFPAFRPLSIGHFDQGMFDMTSGFHWIFIGERI